jgi:DNA uptake protein ComE-like DNA-binding protein
MAVTQKGSAWEFKKSLWIIWGFIILLNGIGMYHIGKKVKVKKWRNYGLLYTATGWICAIVGSEVKGSFLENIAYTVFFISLIGCIIHSFIIRKECLVRLELIEEQKIEQHEVADLRSKIAKEYGMNNIKENTVSKVNAEQSDLLREKSNEIVTENEIPTQPKVRVTPPVIPKVETGNKPMESQEKGLLDINTCSETELSELPGIGLILAKKAVNLRSSRNGFSSVDEFIQELGVKAHFIERLKIRICCTEVKAVESIKTSGRMVDF